MADHEDLKDLGTIRYERYADGDEHEILATFNRVFGAQRTLEEWNWEFKENPAGLDCTLAKFPDGEVVSQFTGIPRRVKVKDQVRTFAEIVDSLTDPRYRRGLKKPGLFASTCLKHVEDFGHPEREAIMYGMPVPQAWRIGQRLLGYEHLYHVELLTGDVTDAPSSASVLDDGLVFTIERSFPPDVEAFTKEVEAAHDVVTIKDLRYLKWRFEQRPNINYDLVVVRAADTTLKAIFVLRHEWLGKPSTAVAEWIVTPDDPKMRTYIRLASALAKEGDSDVLQLFLRPHCPEWEAYRAARFEPESTEWRFVARTYESDLLPIDWLRDAWHVSLGDFDLA